MMYNLPELNLTILSANNTEGDWFFEFSRVNLWCENEKNNIVQVSSLNLTPRCPFSRQEFNINYNSDGRNAK